MGKKIIPGSIRNTAITHDVESGLPLSYICLRSWGEPYNAMINIYTKANSAKMQVDQHGKNGIATGVTDLKPRVIRAMQVCQSCHKDNDHEANFCKFCGSGLKGQKSSMEQRLEQMEITINNLRFLTDSAGIPRHGN
jgi:hypothetical protein